MIERSSRKNFPIDNLKIKAIATLGWGCLGRAAFGGVSLAARYTTEPVSPKSTQLLHLVR